jgi:hypothetical protein
MCGKEIITHTTMLQGKDHTIIQRAILLGDLIQGTIAICRIKVAIFETTKNHRFQIKDSIILVIAIIPDFIIIIKIKVYS